MENAVISFLDPDSKHLIKIVLKYNKETSELDYNIDLGAEYTAKTKMDFIGFLAHMFLTSLQNTDTIKE